MRWTRSAATGLGLLVAYLVLFLAGVMVLGPSGEGLTPAEQATSTWMVLAVAALDLALFAAWLPRARARGWLLWLQAFVVFYGIKTFSSQLEVWWFVNAAWVPPEMLPRLFAMTLPVALGWTGLAVWALGPRDPPPPRAEGTRTGRDLAVRVLIAGAVAYPALFFLAGYFIAWQNPTVRAYYHGPEVALPFFAHLRAMVDADPLVVPFEMARGVLWLAIGWPVLRGTRGPWWLGGLLFAAMLAIVQNDLHLLPNPLMPREVRMWHLVETGSSNFVFGLVAAACLAPRGGWAALLASARVGVWNHTSDRWLARISLPLEVGLGLGGLAGGCLLFFDPTGGLLQLDPALLAGTPFADYELPGLVLLFANGVLPLCAAIAVVTHSPRAPLWVAATGAVLTGWMAAQLAWLGWIFWVQTALLAWALALLSVGGTWVVVRRRSGGSPA